MTPSPNHETDVRELGEILVPDRDGKYPIKLSEHFFWPKILAVIKEAQLTERKRIVEKLKKLDPLEAEGSFWEYGESDDIAIGVHDYMVRAILKET